MIFSAAEFAFGLILVGLTLRDVFDTVVVPGESRTVLRLANRLIFWSLPILRRLRRRGAGVPVAFAPFVLTASFSAWMLLLVLGFGLMVHALHAWYQPPLPTFSQALFVAGSSLVTVGLSETDATGPARWINIAAGFCGLAVMTMAVTYLLQVQGSIARRDTGILKLTTSSGQPPSAVGLLERYAALGCQDELLNVLAKGRDWCAEVLQSHASHPSLIYFRSVGIGAGWPATLGALLDLAALVEAVIDEPTLRGRAALLREEGSHLAKELIKLLGLETSPFAQDTDLLTGVIRRLSTAGYLIQSGSDPERFAALRKRYAPSVAALAQHLGTDHAPLLPE